MSNSGTDGHAWYQPEGYTRHSTSPRIQTTQEDPDGIPPAEESTGAAEEHQPPAAPRRPPER